MNVPLLFIVLLLVCTVHTGHFVMHIRRNLCHCVTNRHVLNQYYSSDRSDDLLIVGLYDIESNSFQ